MADTFIDQLVELDLEISEMTGDASQIVRLDRDRVAQLTEIYEDDKPEFPVLRVRAGMVSKTGNSWPDSILADVAEQVNANEPPGYFGHIRPEDRGFVFPDPQTIWLGATVKQEGGKPTLYVKGYNIPGTKARKHVKSGLVKTASWFGKASGKVVGGVRHVERFVLESIDWARPGSAGMDARVVAVASEMEGGEKEVTEINWGSVTLDDIEKNNPSLFTLMKAKVEGDNAEAVSEMEAKVEEGEKATSLLDKLRALFGIDKAKDMLEAMTEIHERLDNISTGELKQKVSDLILKKFPKDEQAKARATIMRLLPVSEMEGKTDDELTTWVDEQFEKDEEVKAVVSEMVSGPRPLPHHARGNGGNGSKVGGSGMVSESVTKL